MSEHLGPEERPMIGTDGISKEIVDGVIDVLVALGSAFGPPAAPVFVGGGAALKAVGIRLQEHQNRNLQVLLAEGQVTAETTVEALLASIIADPNRLLSFAAACDAARRTALDEKVRALGRAVGTLASDDAKVNDAGIWIDIFSRIDASHIRILHALKEIDPEREGYPRLWKRYELGEQLRLGPTINVLINSLLSLGLMREIPYVELDTHTRSRWGASPPGTGDSPLYGKGPLIDETLDRLQGVAR